MKIMDQYILRQFVVPLGYCLLTFAMVFVIFDLFQHLSDFIDAKTPFPLVLRYYFLIIPALLVFIAPISLLLGLLYSLWQLTKNNELTAMRASGISFFRLALPIAVVGLGFSVGVSLCQETVAPWASYWTDQFIRQQEGKDAEAARYVRPLSFKNEREHRNWFVNSFDLQLYNLQGVRVVQQRADGSDREIIRAEEGRYYGGCWHLFGVQIQKYKFDNSPAGPVETIAEIQPEWSETPRDFVNEVRIPTLKNTDSLSTRELWGYLTSHRTLSKDSYARLSVDLHAHLAMPWTCLIVTLFGIPCGLRTARKGAIIGIATALVTFFSFYMLLIFCQWLGKEQFLEPMVSAWLPNAVFLMIGGLLMIRLR
jgi:lipopolysaccharide export system permease protein